MAQPEYMDIPPEEQKKITLSILDAFDKFSKTHDLKYFLFYGTLLGAARHKGFIPWDDDIDVVMPIEDYLRLQDLLNDGASLPEPYFAASPYLKSSPEFHCPFMKIYDGSTIVKQDSLSIDIGFEEGLWLDVFPFIGFPTQKDIKTVEHTFYILYSKIRLASEKFRPGMQ